MVDGIYPSWETFVKTIVEPLGQKRSHFAQKQEAARKDVERASEVIRTRFAVVHGPAQQWDPETLWEVMTCCVIMHNIIVEDKGEYAASALKFENMCDSIELPE